MYCLMIGLSAQQSEFGLLQRLNELHEDCCTATKPCIGAGLLAASESSLRSTQGRTGTVTLPYIVGRG